MRMKTLKGGDENNKFSAYTAYHQTDKGPMGKVVNGSLDVIDCDHQRLFLLIVSWEQHSELDSFENNLTKLLEASFLTE